MAERVHPNVQIHWAWDEACRLYYGGDYGPSIVQRLPSDLSAEAWANIAELCIGTKAVFQVVGEGETLADCVTHVGRLSDDDVLTLVPDTWSMQIKHLGKIRRLHPTERRQNIEMFRSVLGVLTQRIVDLENPDTELVLLKDCRSLEDLDPSTDRQEVHYHWLLKRIKSTIYPSAKTLVERSDVKKRAFISTTTMPADRALLMANLAGVQKGNVVLDPFCGSGGLLLASALLGATVVGGDVDEALLGHENQPLASPASSGRPNRGVEKVSYADSFVELQQPVPTILSGANILSESVAWTYLAANEQHRYDAIITDPPYGIRESQSQVGTWNMARRLCQVAGMVLKPQGRLVYLQVLEGTIDQAEAIKSQLYQETMMLIDGLHLAVVEISVERFNMRHLRATIVLTCVS